MSPAAGNALIAWLALGLAYVEGYRRVGGFIAESWPARIGMALFITALGPICWLVLAGFAVYDRMTRRSVTVSAMVTPKLGYALPDVCWRCLPSEERRATHETIGRDGERVPMCAGCADSLSRFGMLVWPR